MELLQTTYAAIALLLAGDEALWGIIWISVKVCFLALVLHRVMRMRLRKADAGLSPASSLGVLRQIQHHRISLNGTRVVRGLSKINDLQSRILRALGVPTPDINSIDRQLELGL